MVVTALVYGHSYVRRLGDFASIGENEMVNFGLDGTKTQVFCVGLGGGTIYPGRKCLAACVNTNMIHQHQPDILFLQAGENDISVQSFNKQSAEQLALGIVNFCQYLHECFNVRYIILGQLLPRLIPGFNGCVADVNNAILALLQDRQYTFVRFWHHRGFWREPSHLYLADRVHFNHVGTLKYAKSVRAAIGLCLKECF